MRADKQKQEAQKTRGDSETQSRNFHDVGSIDQVGLGESKVFSIKGQGKSQVEIAVFNLNGKFYAVSNICVHKGGPINKGTIDGSIVTCPWHGWKYSVKNGKSPHKGGDNINSYPVRISQGRIFLSGIPKSRGKRISEPHKRYQLLDRAVKRHIISTTRLKPSPLRRKLRVLGISATNMNDQKTPRSSTSEAALEFALDFAKRKYKADTVMIKLRQLNFRHCEGYYSKNANACIFPCSISEMDVKDQMIEIYDKVIVWADVVIVATPIRWGNASSLYYQMVQRLNCVQNQIITHDNYLIRDKVGAFIITGGQDNVQHVAGELLSFWSQLGFIFGKFPFVGWSRGWYAEDTENNVETNAKSSAFETDIERMVSGAMEISNLINENKYDERVLAKS